MNTPKQHPARTEGEPETGVPRVEAVIKKMRAAVSDVQVRKARADVSGATGPYVHRSDPIVDAINALPGWARELEMAVLDIEGDYEAYEDRALSTPARPGVDRESVMEALKPFAEIADGIRSRRADSSTAVVETTYGDLRRARAILALLQHQTEEG